MDLFIIEFNNNYYIIDSYYEIIILDTSEEGEC